MRGQLNWDYLPDRRWLQHTYLPQLSGRILYIGVEQYNDFYHELVHPGSCFITLDKDPDKAVFGSLQGHLIQDLLDHDGNYDHVACYGLLGFDVFTGFQQFHHHLDSLVNPGGTLLLGHHLSEGYQRSVWASRIKEDLPSYEVLVCEPPGVWSNYIWWGKKQAN